MDRPPGSLYRAHRAPHVPGGGPRSPSGLGLRASALLAVAAVVGACASEGAPGGMVTAGTEVTEVLGLEEWTVEMITDSMARFAPGVSLADAACAVILRDSLGFAQAAVQSTRDGERVWHTVSVVEPDDSDRVRLRSFPEREPVRPEWSEAVRILQGSPRVVTPLQDHDFLLGRTDAFWGRPEGGAAVAFRDEIRRIAERTGDGLALWTLAYDGTPDNRAIAAAILGHFPERETTWRALIQSLRGPSDFAGSVAERVLSGLVRAEPRPVDWRPVHRDLAHLMAGANLFSYETVLEVLAATEVDPALGRTLLAANPSLLADNASSANPHRRRRVRQFLVRVSGEDFGDDPAAWAAWIRRASAAEPDPLGEGVAP